MEQELAESQLKGQLESATQQAEQYKVISFVLLVPQLESCIQGLFWYLCRLGFSHCLLSYILLIG